MTMHMVPEPVEAKAPVYVATYRLLLGFSKICYFTFIQAKPPFGASFSRFLAILYSLAIIILHFIVYFPPSKACGDTGSICHLVPYRLD